MLANRGASAKVYTAKARKAVERRLYLLVAKRFSKLIVRNQNWSRDLELRPKMIEYLNAEIRRQVDLMSVRPQGITGKWLSWPKNQKGIENAVRADVNAKA